MQKAVTLLLLLVVAAAFAVPTPPEVDPETGLLIETEPVLQPADKQAPPVDPVYAEWLQHNSGEPWSELDAQWDPKVRLTYNSVYDYNNSVANYGKQVAVDPSGRIHVVWQSSQSPGTRNPQIYYKRWYPVGGWTTDTCISADLASSGTGSNPTIACDSLGNIHVVWQYYQNTVSPYNYEIRYKGCTPTTAGNGGWGATSARISTLPSVTHYQYYPVIAATPNNNLHVVWYHYYSTMGYVLRYAERIGTTWQTAVAVDSGPTTYWYMFNPSIAGGRDNNIHVVCYGRLASVSSYYYIMYKGRFSGTWQSSWTNVSQASGSYYQYTPCIATNPTTNRAHIAWRGYGASYYYRIIHKERLGTGTSDTFQLVGDTISGIITQYQYGNPSLIFTPNGMGHCTWYGYSPLSTSYYQVRYVDRSAAGAWGTAVDLTSGSYYNYYPSISNGGNSSSPNDVYIVWTDPSYYLYEISLLRGAPPPPNDVGVSKIVVPSGLYGLEDIDPSVWVKNYGTASQNNFGVKLDIGASYTSTVTVTTALGPGDSANVTGFLTWTPSATGSYAVKCSTRLTGDANNANDAKTTTAIVADWVQDFEDNNGNYRSYGGWSWGEPGSNRPAPPSGINCWGDVLTGYYGASARDSLISPMLLATQDTPSIMFMHWLYCESYWDGGGVYYSTNDGSSWTLMYPDTTGGRRPYYGTLSTGHIGWSGSFPWELAKFNVPVSDGDEFWIMWLFTSDASVQYDGGWLVDDAAGLGCRNIIDVATTGILEPTGTINFGTVVTPQAVVWNYSNSEETFPVVFNIDDFYSDTVDVVLPAGGCDTLAFATWTADLIGDHATTCMTLLSTDENPANDTVTGSFFVYLVDVGPTEIIAPAGNVPQGTVVSPRVRVRNYGSQAATFTVALRIGDSYRNLRLVTDLAADTEAEVGGFTNWTATSTGTFAARCTTYLSGDMRPENDDVYQTFNVCYLDAEAVAIRAPAGAVFIDEEVFPAFTVRNNSSMAVTFDVNFQIDDGSDALVYDETMTVTVDPGVELEDQFAVGWMATPAGGYTTRLAVALTGDANSSNDVLVGAFTVSPRYTEGWVEMARTLGPVKDGGWLTRNEADGLIYAGRGYKSLDFYSYDALTNTWVALPAIPAGAKPASKGANGIVAGDFVYFVKGYNTFEFYRYDLVGGSGWTQLPDVPLGTSGKKVKACDLAYVPGGDSLPNYVYMIKGNKSDFMRFNTETLAWEMLPDAPPGMKPKWDKGSFLAYDGENTIYAHKAKYMEMWPFDLATSTWGATALPGMPLVGKTGKSKKAKDGSNAAFYNSTIHALKGGNTCEFWKFEVAAGVWTEHDTMPQVGSTGKKKRVKFGGDVVSSGDGAFFAFKANKTMEFWRYFPPILPAAPQPARSGVMAGETPGQPFVKVGPNPITGGMATVRYALPSAGPASVHVFDVTGRTVLSRSLVASRSGAVSLDLRNLSAGIYLVRVEADGFTGTQKLVIQH
ncbi:MAG: T9SS type A sorting domain-containing protein [bacterium]